MRGRRRRGFTRAGPPGRRREQDREAPDDTEGSGRPGDEPPEIEPGAVAVLRGSTFMISDQKGDVRPGSLTGLFYEDTRLLSDFRLTVDGRTPRLLSSGQTDHHAARFFLVNPSLREMPADDLSIQRDRVVWDGLHEDITVRSHRNEPTRFTLGLAVGADFADLFEVKEGAFTKAGELERGHDPGARRMRFEYRNGIFAASTFVSFSQPVRIVGDTALFDVEIAARGEWSTCVVMRWHEDPGPRLPGHDFVADASEGLPAGSFEWQPVEEYRLWRAAFPQLECDSDVVRRVYERSIADLAALRLHVEVGGTPTSLPAGGLPWFMTIFGRDTLVTSYQSLLMAPGLAVGALRALAELQGDHVDDFRDEEPGKILHEIRFGELAVLGHRPHRPYYGSADATPLWLILLSEYHRISGDDGVVRDLWPNVLRALAWIDGAGDVLGDRYVSYATRSPQGLPNQGWKDSTNAVLFADGEPAQAPIAVCEVQGYVYDAKLRIGGLAASVIGDVETADRLRWEAVELAERFNKDFWLEERGGYYALALDGERRRVDAMTSNMGHLLWSGIVPEDRAGVVVEQLFSPAMWSGWGVRTMSSQDLGYNPVHYHNGTVWPHDNSLIAAGLARYGFREEANRIAVAMFEAASHQAYRLPEVFAGYPRRESRFPVRYPTASSPQAWATAAPFLWLRLMLGLDLLDGELVCEPALPPEFGSLTLVGVQAKGMRFKVDAEGSSGSVMSLADDGAPGRR